MLDLPGGMRIGTIHAFCQSLLRRFPLEAALSPHFRLVDDRDAEDALTEARETHAGARQRAAHARRARHAGRPRIGRQFGRHVATLQADLPRLQRRARRWATALEAAQRRALGVTAATRTEIIAVAVNWQAERALREAARSSSGSAPKACAERAGRILDWLGLEPAERSEHWQHWCEEFLTKEGKPRAASGFVSKAVHDAHPDLRAVFLAECDRIVAAIDACLRAAAWPRSRPRC